MYEWQQIDWENPEALISDNFKVREALRLNQWNVLHIPSDAEKQHIVKLAASMEDIRTIFNKGISVHCWIRPTSVNCNDPQYMGKNYNKAVGSTSTKSAHIAGRAVDFHIIGLSSADDCAVVREEILPHLETFNLRMEDHHGGWIHIDNKPVINSRFFKVN